MMQSDSVRPELPHALVICITPWVEVLQALGGSRLQDIEHHETVRAAPLAMESLQRMP